MLTTFTPKSIDVRLSSVFAGKYGLLYLFSCSLMVVNNSNSPVTMIGKHWSIYSSDKLPLEIIGEGFNGESPVLQPKSQFLYETILPLHTPFASIQSDYTIKVLNESSKTFIVSAPALDLTPTPFLN